MFNQTTKFMKDCNAEGVVDELSVFILALVGMIAGVTVLLVTA